MAGDTSIGWTDGTLNPWTWRCAPVAPECDNCYAWTWTDRWQGAGAFLSSPPALRHGRLLLPWLDPVMRHRERLFLASMSDPFHPAIPAADQALVWAMMAASPHITWQVLTKRPHVMRKVLTRPGLPGRVQDAIGELIADLRLPSGRLTLLRSAAAKRMTAAAEAFAWPLPNVHLGVSAGLQDTADKFLPPLRDTPAALHWVSAEPLLGRLDLGDALDWLGWAVIGGESGRVHTPDPWNPPAGLARPMRLGWASDLAQACTERTVPVYVKQLGSVATAALGIDGDFKGEDTTRWPDTLTGLKLRQLPQLSPDARRGRYAVTRVNQIEG